MLHQRAAKQAVVSAWAGYLGFVMCCGHLSRLVCLQPVMPLVHRATELAAVQWCKLCGHAPRAVSLNNLQTALHLNGVHVSLHATSSSACHILPGSCQTMTAARYRISATQMECTFRTCTSCSRACGWLRSRQLLCLPYQVQPCRSEHALHIVELLALINNNAACLAFLTGCSCQPCSQRLQSHPHASTCLVCT